VAGPGHARAGQPLAGKEDGVSDGILVTGAMITLVRGAIAAERVP
jgi:hypothetical protein